jgi:cation transport ATPase
MDDERQDHAVSELESSAALSAGICRYAVSAVALFAALLHFYLILSDLSNAWRIVPALSTLLLGGLHLWGAINQVRLLSAVLLSFVFFYALKLLFAPSIWALIRDRAFAPQLFADLAAVAVTGTSLLAVYWQSVLEEELSQLRSSMFTRPSA